MKAMRFARDVKTEMGKVTWPTMKSTRTMTMVVILLAFVMSLYLWGVDVVLRGAVNWLLGA